MWFSDEDLREKFSNLILIECFNKVNARQREAQYAIQRLNTRQPSGKLQLGLLLIETVALSKVLKVLTMGTFLIFSFRLICLKSLSFKISRKQISFAILFQLYDVIRARLKIRLPFLYSPFEKEAHPSVSQLFFSVTHLLITLTS